MGLQQLRWVKLAQLAQSMRVALLSQESGSYSFQGVAAGGLSAKVCCARVGYGQAVSLLVQLMMRAQAGDDRVVDISRCAAAAGMNSTPAAHTRIIKRSIAV
jgi:hypothetical protein